MYLITDRFILQFYIVYLIEFYISVYFYNPTAQNIWDFPKITTKWSKVIYFVVDMEYVEESDYVVIHCEAYTAMYLRENRSYLNTRKIKTGKYNLSHNYFFSSQTCLWCKDTPGQIPPEGITCHFYNYCSYHVLNITSIIFPSDVIYLGVFHTNFVSYASQQMSYHMHAKCTPNTYVTYAKIHFCISIPRVFVFIRRRLLFIRIFIRPGWLKQIHFKYKGYTVNEPTLFKHIHNLTKILLQ